MRATPLGALAIAVICATVWSASAGAQPDSAAKGCADLGGTVDAEGICHVVAGSQTYGIDMSYPLDYPDQWALTDYLRHDRDEFVDYVTTIPSRGRSYENAVTSHSYRSGPVDTGTASVVLEEYGDTGAHPVTSFHAFNYDLAAKAPITFDSFFRAGVDPVAVLDPIVQREMENRWRGYQDPAPHNTLGSKVYQAFALTDDTVIFYIGQGMWLPEVAGAQRISVPRSELASVIA